QTIVHFKGESTKKNSLNYVRIFYQAMNVFVKKHYGNNAWMIRILLTTGIYIRAFISLVTYLFKHQRKIRGDEPAITNIILAGDPISVAEADNIIKHNLPEATIKKLQSLHSLSRQDKFAEIVFCTGRL